MDNSNNENTPNLFLTKKQMELVRDLETLHKLRLTSVEYKNSKWLLNFINAFVFNKDLPPHEAKLTGLHPVSMVRNGYKYGSPIDQTARKMDRTEKEADFILKTLLTLSKEPLIRDVDIEDNEDEAYSEEKAYSDDDAYAYADLAL